MMVPSPEQRDYIDALDTLLTRADPLQALPDEPGDRVLDRGLWRELADTGALALLAAPPAEQDVATALLVSECLGRHVAPLPYLSTVLAATLLARLPGTPAGLLDEMAAGTRLATVGMIGVDGLLHPGADVRATRSDAGWRLTGRLPFVPDGDAADLAVVVADADERPAAFLVDLADPGVVRHPLVCLDQTRPFAAVTLDQVAATPVSTDPEELAATLAAARAIGVGILAADLAGTIRAMLDMSVAYAKTRVQFGRAIAGRQAIKHKCASMLILVESARSAVYHLADQLGDANPERDYWASLAKAFCAEAAATCATEAMQIHGGIGFTWEHRLHRYVKRATLAAGLLGDADHHHEAVLAHLEAQHA